MKKFLKRALLILILLLLVVPIVIAAAWIGTESAIERTSDAEFCRSCHTMEPFAATHEKDVHGGANSGGVVAECTDCRLPHDTAAHHLFAKARTGLRDLWAQAINFAHKPDWIGLLEERSNYVYGSGCLDCHAALERASRDNPTAAAVHDAYFADTEGQSCVDCHQHIGLAGLRDAFVDYFDEVEPSDVPGREEAPAPGAASEQG